MQFTTHHLSRGLKFPEDKETKEVQFPKSLEHNCFRILKTIKKTEHHKNKAYDMPIFLFQIRQLISNQLHCFFFFFFLQHLGSGTSAFLFTSIFSITASSITNALPTMWAKILQPPHFSVLPVCSKLCCNPAASIAARAHSTVRHRRHTDGCWNVVSRIPLSLLLMAQLIITKVKGNLGAIFLPTPPSKPG